MILSGQQRSYADQYDDAGRQAGRGRWGASVKFLRNNFDENPSGKMETEL